MCDQLIDLSSRAYCNDSVFSAFLHSSYTASLNVINTLLICQSANTSKYATSCLTFRDIDNPTTEFESYRMTKLNHNQGVLLSAGHGCSLCRSSKKKNLWRNCFLYCTKKYIKEFRHKFMILIILFMTLHNINRVLWLHVYYNRLVFILIINFLNDNFSKLAGIKNK